MDKYQSHEKDFRIRHTRRKHRGKRKRLFGVSRLEESISFISRKMWQHIRDVSRLLYWRDASHNTLDYCIGGMHLIIH